MTIRKTTPRDLDTVMRIYAEARAYMQENGNPDQWKGGRPARETIERDIEAGTSYVCIREGSIAAVFYFNIERDPTYEKIDGRWLNDQPCGVVHRIARSREAKGVGALCLSWCFEQCHNLKIDTHRANLPMRKLLDNLGFVYCGIIWTASGDERLAFQKTGQPVVGEPLPL